MDNFLDEYFRAADFWHSVQNVVVALLVLLIGWLIAKGIGGSIEKGLKKSKLVEKLFAKFNSDGSSVDVEHVIGKTIYYILLLVVFIVFFNLLNLDMIASPLSGLMTTFFDFIPAVLKAGLILVLAWVIAFVLKWLIVEGSKKVNAQKLFAKIKLADTEEDVKAVTENAGRVVFYLVLLMFVPAILKALSIGGLAEPFSSMLTTILAFIPKLLAAVLVFGIGWLVAKIIKNILVNLLQAVGSETWVKRLKLDQVFAENNFATFVGNVVFVLIMIPVTVTALEKLKLAGIAQPAIGMLNKVMDLLPNIIMAIALVLVGIWLGKVIGHFVHVSLERIGFNRLTQKMNIKNVDESSRLSPAALTGYIVQTLIVFVLTVQALYLIKLDFLVSITSAITAYLPLVLSAILILGVALIVANIVEKIIISLLDGPTVKILAGFAKYAIVALAVFMALTQLGIATTIVTSAFIITLGGLALAFGLAFGLGGKDFASKNLQKLDEAIHETKVKEVNHDQDGDGQ